MRILYEILCAHSDNECYEYDLLECETVNGYQYLDEPAGSTFFLENGDDRYYQNIDTYSLDYKMSHYRRP
jgi:hypothetical protein